MLIRLMAGMKTRKSTQPFAVCMPIALATSASYRVDVLDADRDLSCAVTAAGLTVAESAPVPVEEPATATFAEGLDALSAASRSEGK